MIDLNEYLYVFPEAKEGDKCFDMDLNYILLNNIPTSCIRQAHVQGFDCEIISFVLAVNMFERM